ncbi:putative pentatricopeptide repeat-containing protein At1g64310 [Impatiens glandulifera]|uniref:putative pentatricopeptide repeat-containing protein At1g64310 n=1 Tax=Impatiens glandulifera TaxID=253017 RepID=UPI001FB0F1B1|nr:putative pentatricopeptide repeat-containing protein At1g64310 [Impatiens glandulifera]XP_047326993.1 putative pentatricopeptide repeat-containing protein At1g64310 [Impatiens glandulifera]
MFIQLRSLLSEILKPYQNLLITKQLHSLIITKTTLSNDPFYATKFIRLYAINGDLHSARLLFDRMSQRTVFLWNSIIRAYARFHLFGESFLMFRKMLTSETKPDNFTFACILRACSENLDSQGLKRIHGAVEVLGVRKDPVVSSALVTAYSKLGLVGEASVVFDEMPDPDLVLWNSMTSGYGYSGCWNNGLRLFNTMRSMGKQPDAETLVGLMSSLLEPNLLGIGRSMHNFCLKSGFDSSPHIGSVLVSMYSRCKCLNSALKVFHSIYHPDLVTWSALITGLSQSGENEKAIALFKEMNIMVVGNKADCVLIASLVSVIAQLAVLGHGTELHGYIVRHGLDSDVMVSSALVDMYVKCGFLPTGLLVFRKMPTRNVISYNLIMHAFALNGLPFDSFRMFEEMLMNGYQPDESTFSALLCACCHAGLVEYGQVYYKRMKDEFSLEYRIEHNIYMVKLLGMAGKLQEAYEFIKSLAKPVDSSVWGAFLSCCDVLGNSEMAEIAAKWLFENREDGSAYRVMISNVYAGNGKWDEATKLRDRLTKMPGISWTNVL